MKQNIFNTIDTSEIKDDTFSINELVSNIKNQLSENPVLLSGKSKKGILGDFDSNMWAIRDTLKETNVYFDFHQFEKLKFKGVTDNDITLLKCWTIENIFNSEFEDEEFKYRNLRSFQFNLKVLYKLMDISNNFCIDFLNKQKGSNLNTFINEHISKRPNNRIKSDAICAILNYIEYVDYKVSSSYMDNLLKYMAELNAILPAYGVKNKKRKLPSTKNILYFGSYINIFFSDSNIPSELKLYYMPILLWWKITTIIPMRPSEFARKIKRDSLINENGDYYLKIDRVKKVADTKNNLLPVLNRIKITDELYGLINDYIVSTNNYGKSKTLLSYRALVSLRKQILKKYPKYKNWNIHNQKINEDVFSFSILYSLLNSFFDFVIKIIYKDSLIDEQLKLGDTRHIAFTSLMLQGYSPVEIAIIGGHRTLRTLDNYTSTLGVYVDSEVISMVRKNIKISTYANDTIMNIVFNMPSTPPIPLDKCIIADIDGVDLGYCTNQFEINTNPCEHNDCYYCSKWWCEPTEHNFLILEKIVKAKLITKNNKLARDLDFIKSLLKDVGLSIYDNNLVINKSVAETLKRKSLNLKSDVENIINLKYQLINPCQDTFKLLSDINDLLPSESFYHYINNQSSTI